MEESTMAVPGLDENLSASQLDEKDPLKHIRQEFIIPTKGDISRKTLAKNGEENASANEPCVYLVGNSLGLQPARTATRIEQYLTTWRTQGVQGHFKPLEDSPLPTWLDVDSRASQMVAPIVGAKVEEVAVMQTLTANLHLLMAAFYKPDINGRHKVILESKAFPSDHFVVETQIRHHGLSPEESTVALKSSDSGDILDTEYVKKVISEHAETAAILLLPGIQYYSGQFLDIPTITAFARSKGIFVIWDLAHAVGNVPLSLHDWDVDAAAWCSYKYLNGGPGCIGGLFVHERNSRAPDPSVGTEDSEMQPARNRFAGWWGNDKSTRFAMTPGFHPVAGAAGFQLSNPSVLDITSLCASLEVFELAGGLAPLRAKSLQLTGYLERELYRRLSGDLRQYWRVITPRESERRGAQLSLLLADGLLERVMARLEEQGVLVDERRPNVIRVAPAPLYNTYQDCFDFVGALENALRSALKD